MGTDALPTQGYSSLVPKQASEIPASNKSEWMGSKFVLFTSIPPSLERLRNGREVGAAYQRACVESWRNVGFSVVTVNSATEADAVGSLKLPVRVERVESVASANRPPIADILALASASSAKICGIINADCMLLKCANFVSVLSRHVEESLIICERINIDNDTGLPVTGPTGGFDAFFFQPSSVADVSNRYFRLGDPWWDFWFPIELASRGITVQRLSTPVLLHLLHPKAWTTSSESFRANENYLLHYVEGLVTEGRVPPGLPEKAQRAGEFWAWLRSRPEREPIRFLGSNLLDFEVLLGNLRESLRVDRVHHHLSEVERLKQELASLQQVHLGLMSKHDLVLDRIDKIIDAECEIKLQKAKNIAILSGPVTILARAFASVSKLRAAIVAVGILLLEGITSIFLTSHGYAAVVLSIVSAILAVTAYAMLSYVRRVKSGTSRVLRKMARIRGRQPKTHDRL